LIYCNISECSNWKALDTPVDRERPIGYVPLFKEEPFKGTCSLKGTKIKASVARSLSGVKQLIHECVSYNEIGEESSGIVCTESGCLYNTLSDGCNKGTIYIEDKKISDRYNGNSVVPMCLTYSDRKYSGHFDWRRIAEGGYGYTSNAPDSTPSSSSAVSGPRRY